MATTKTGWFSGTMGARAMRGDTQKLTDASAMSSSLVGTAIREMETVRVFNAGDFMRRAWLSQLDKTQALRRRISWLQGLTQTITKSTTGLMSITVVTIAATLVVAGELDIGIMIACNILGARALQPVSRFAQLGSTFAKAREALVREVWEETGLVVEVERNTPHNRNPLLLKPKTNLMMVGIGNNTLLSGDKVGAAR